MKRLLFSNYLFVVFVAMQFSAGAQQSTYTAAEAYAIHDSINNSRWDIGGRLSHYSFRFMSEFFPVAIIEKPATAYRFSEKPLKGIENINLAEKVLKPAEVSTLEPITEF